MQADENRKTQQSKDFYNWLVFFLTSTANRVRESVQQYIKYTKKEGMRQQQQRLCPAL